MRGMSMRGTPTRGTSMRGTSMRGTPMRGTLMRDTLMRDTSVKGTPMGGHTYGMDTYERHICERHIYGRHTYGGHIKPSPHPIQSVPLLCYNALQDSIIVTRDKNSSLGQFYLDKVKTPYIKLIPEVLPFLRPEFVSGCPCLQLQTHGPVVYCPACTTFRVPQAQQAQ
jgi:hypothetical protein